MRGVGEGEGGGRGWVGGPGGLRVGWLGFGVEGQWGLGGQKFWESPLSSG